MKHLCCSRLLTLLLLFSLSLFASLEKRSAVIYYGDELSYPTVGIQDYIIVKPENINTYRHGFGVYREKIYATIDLSDSLEDVYDSINTAVKKGFINFYFTTSQEESAKRPFVDRILTYLDVKVPNLKVILNTKIVTKSYSHVVAVVLSPKATLSTSMQKMLRQKKIDIIQVIVKPANMIADADEEIAHVESAGMIPYITNSFFDIYGRSSKVALKREIFTLIDESKDDRTLLGAHQAGALPIEYLGYIQKLYDINKGLPEVEKMMHYAGVVVWLREDYADPSELVEWVLELNKLGIKVAFANNFGFSSDAMLLKPLDIDVFDGDESLTNKKKIYFKDKIIGFEVEPSLGESSIYMEPHNAEPLLVYEDANGLRSTPAAITEWGGYAVSEAFMVELGEENVWIINPFEFFRRALRLKPLIVPDPTTHNGKRLFFSHVDGDGMANAVEFNPELYSGDIILEEILKKYDVPHSISLIGAEIEKNGLFPEKSARFIKTAKEMYALKNVEAATHTFTHPFFWGEIKDGNLIEEYRLKPKGYQFSFDSELKNEIAFINRELKPKNRATTVFWSGDCSPRADTLEYIYKHNILNINGGDTTISNLNPWLTLVAPLGLEREGYYQIYTGAQNENVFTNDWLGPFWGFKRVVQTFKHTETPRRLKPIDIYYHIYSGSKKASLNALRYVLEWTMKQDIFPIFTSEYIPKAMDYFTVSMAQEGDRWLVAGMKNLKTIRVESKEFGVDYKSSPTIYGEKQEKSALYISLGEGSNHLITLTKSKKARAEQLFIYATNAEIQKSQSAKSTQYILHSYMPVKFSFHLPKSCRYTTEPKATLVKKSGSMISLSFKNSKHGIVNVICK